MDMKRERIDRILVDRGLADTRAKAQALVMAGCVFAGDSRVEKPGQLIDPGAAVKVRGQDHPYVGRGGVKLAHALDEFGLKADGLVCMDVGASTGGFTDCLLQRGAARVYAVDVGYGQIAWKLARDDRVVVIERTNIRHLEKSAVPDPIELAVIDVSFISLELVFPAVEPFLAPSARIVALVKPQFEVGRELVGKGGIVRDEASHKLAVEKGRRAGESVGWSFEGSCDSPVRGAKGNREFLVCFSKP